MAFVFALIAAVAISTASAQCGGYGVAGINGYAGDYAGHGLGLGLGGAYAGDYAGHGLGLGAGCAGGYAGLGLGGAYAGDYAGAGYAGAGYASGVHSVQLSTCGPLPTPVPAVAVSEVAPTVRHPTVTLPSAPLPAPRVINQICRCQKTVVKPQIVKKRTVVPSVQTVVQRGYAPVTETLNWAATPACACADNAGYNGAYGAGYAGAYGAGAYGVAHGGAYGNAGCGCGY